MVEKVVCHFEPSKELLDYCCVFIFYASDYFWKDVPATVGAVVILDHCGCSVPFVSLVKIKGSNGLTYIV